MRRPSGHPARHRPAGLVLGCCLLLLVGCKPPLREAESLMQAKRYQQAERVLSQLVAKDPSIDAQALLAQASFYTQGPDVAIDQLQALYPKFQDERSFKQAVPYAPTISIGFDTQDRLWGVINYNPPLSDGNFVNWSDVALIDPSWLRRQIGVVYPTEAN